LERTEKPAEQESDTYIKEFGFFFFLRMAVAVSSTWKTPVSPLSFVMAASRIPTSFFSAPEASLQHVSAFITGMHLEAHGRNSLQVDLGLGYDVFWFGRHVELVCFYGFPSGWW